MDFEYGERYEGFRKEVRVFLEDFKDQRPIGRCLKYPAQNSRNGSRFRSSMGIGRG